MQHNTQTRESGAADARAPLGATRSIDLPALAPASVSVAPMDLLGLIHRAATALACARTMAEAVSAMKLAQAAKELGRIVGAANEARADCLRVELLAQMRIAKEYEAAQARGEVATQNDGRPQSVQASDTSPATLAEMGLDRRRITEWRKMADAGEQVVLAAISSALDEGREATAADVKRTITGGPLFKYFTGNNEWYTPNRYVEDARSVLGDIDLDPASCEQAQQTVRATCWYGEADDGLTNPWHGRVWLNPPYSTGLIERFADKLVAEYRVGRVAAAIALVDPRSDTRWFYALAKACTRWCFTRGRINFCSAGPTLSRPANGSVFFYFGPDAARFERVFARHGYGGSVSFQHEESA